MKHTNLNKPEITTAQAKQALEIAVSQVEKKPARIYPCFSPLL